MWPSFEIGRVDWTVVDSTPPPLRCIPTPYCRTGLEMSEFFLSQVYGPKGVGALYVRKKGPRVRLRPQIDGGGQEFGLRSGRAVFHRRF